MYGLIFLLLAALIVLGFSLAAGTGQIVQGLTGAAPINPVGRPPKG